MNETYGAVAPIAPAEQTPEEQIEQLEQRVQELLAQIFNLREHVVDWHSAMFAALKLILKPYRFNLTMEREHLLNLMPTRIDCLIVKKDESIPIDMDVFRLFRKHNVIELKSYEDALNADVLWHTIGYAAQYKSMADHVNEIPIDDVTITIFRSTFPRGLFRTLEKEGWSIEERYHNIFYLTGAIIPIQIVVVKDLGEDYLPLQILTGKAKESDVRRFAAFRERLSERGDKNDANAVMQACAEANRELFQKIMEDEKMQSVLREIMNDEFVKVRAEGKEEGMAEGMAKGSREGAANAYDHVVRSLICDGADGNIIIRATGFDRSKVESIARDLNRIVTWSDTRA